MAVNTIRKITLTSILATSIIIGFLFLVSEVFYPEFWQASTRLALSTFCDAVIAHHHGILYSGRWHTTPDQLGKEAGFGGASFEFAVYNASFVHIDLSNTRSCCKFPYSISSDAPIDQASLILTPAQSRFVAAPPLDVIVSINGSHDAYYSKVWGVMLVVNQLNRDHVHTIKVMLPMTDIPSTLQFRQLWLAKGGKVIHPSRVHEIAAVELASSDLGYDIGAIKDIPWEMKELAEKVEKIFTLPSRDVRGSVEVMATMPLLGAVPRSPDLTQANTRTWPALIEEKSVNTTFTTIPQVTRMCMTKQCQEIRERAGLPPLPPVQKTFFRAGPPGTHLYKYIWPFGSSTTIPSALVLMLGLPDAETFLANKPPNKHKLTQFAENFAVSYSSFIQTIRRTAYSPSTMARWHYKALMQNLLGEGFDRDSDMDESHLYNSAPSTLPIFLVLPPVPSSLLVPRSEAIRSILHEGTTKVLKELKWHIGDKHTFVIDTAGWLDDSDFVAMTGNDETLAAQFGLTQSGHTKFAHHMSLHLCHYLKDSSDNTIDCPFDRHEEYTGNLYTPDTASVGKLIEEKKVQGIKELFGVEG